MNRLRLYLVLSILIVGLIPDPDRLFGEEYDDCHQYNSAFIHVSWEYYSCAWGPLSGTVIIVIPGYILRGGENGLGKEIFPAFLGFFDGVTFEEYRIWGSIYQPYLWRDKSSLRNLHFKLLPETQFIWSEYRN